MTNDIKRDGSGFNPIGLGPVGVKSITANTAITDLAIVPATNVNIYFVGDATTFLIDAGVAIIVTPGLRLSTTTTCLVY